MKVQRERTPNIQRRTSNDEVDPRLRGDDKKERKKEMKKKVQSCKVTKAEEGKIIELTWGKVAIVDGEDFERLSSYKWCAVKERRNWYAKTLRRNGMPLAMHRLITNAPKHLVVDHRDHNGLDNRKENLRLCTKRQNSHNQRPRVGKTSRYKGVYWKRGAKKFVAQIYIKGKKIWLGYFTDEIAAAKAYDKKAKELFGEFAYLNFPS